MKDFEILNHSSLKPFSLGTIDGVSLLSKPISDTPSCNLPRRVLWSWSCITFNFSKAYLNKQLPNILTLKHWATQVPSKCWNDKFSYNWPFLWLSVGPNYFKLITHPWSMSPNTYISLLKITIDLRVKALLIYWILGSMNLHEVIGFGQPLKSYSNNVDLYQWLSQPNYKFHGMGSYFCLGNLMSSTT